MTVRSGVRQGPLGAVPHPTSAGGVGGGEGNGRARAGGDLLPEHAQGFLLSDELDRHSARIGVRFIGGEAWRVQIMIGGSHLSVYTAWFNYAYRYLAETGLAYLFCPVGTSEFPFESSFWMIF